jgi:hypothetical protein
MVFGKKHARLSTIAITKEHQSKPSYSTTVCCVVASKKKVSKGQRPTPNAIGSPILSEKAKLELRSFALGISQNTEPQKENPKRPSLHPKTPAKSLNKHLLVNAVDSLN